MAVHSPSVLVKRRPASVMTIFIQREPVVGWEKSAMVLILNGGLEKRAGTDHVQLAAAARAVAHSSSKGRRRCRRLCQQRSRHLQVVLHQLRLQLPRSPARCTHSVIVKRRQQRSCVAARRRRLDAR